MTDSQGDSLDNETKSRFDECWIREAEDRLAAYRRGEIREVTLEEAIANIALTQRRASKPRSG